MKTTTNFNILLFCIFLIASAKSLKAQLDTTFGNQGKVITTLNQSDKIIALAKQSDGKIIALGQHHLVRYHTNGNLDSTFVNGGIIDSLGYKAASLLVDGNNKIYVGGNFQGSTGYSTGSATLARYLPNGSVDTTYGQNGKITDGSYAVFSALAIQDNGKIVAGAHKMSIGSFTYLHSTIKRFHSDGRMDSTYLSLPSTDITSIIKRIEVLPNGQLLAVGFGQAGIGVSYYGCISARFNPTGSIDSSYGSNGIASSFVGNFIIGIPPLDEVGSALIDDNGKVFFQTVSYNPNNYQIERIFRGYTQQGQSNTIFNATYNSGANALQAMAAYSEKRFVSAGTSNGDFSLKILNEFAQIDTSCFSSLAIDLGGNEKVGAVLIDEKGDILIAGESNSAFAIAKVVQTCLSKDDFVTTWRTNNKLPLYQPNTNDTSIMITVNPNYSYNYDIDWNNDGVFDTLGVLGSITHQFPTIGTYTIRIRGDFPAINIRSNKITRIEQWGTYPWKKLDHAFYNCQLLTHAGDDVPNLDSITSLNNAFFSTDLQSGNLSNWDVTKITNMNGLFYNASNFNLDINNWDVSNVRHMSWMFYNASSFNQALDQWDVSEVRNMHRMFSGASSFNQDISNWDVSNVTNMSRMFEYANNFNQALNAWDVSNVENLFAMFALAVDFNQPLSNWDVSRVRDMRVMFRYAQNFDQNLSNWAIDSIINMSGIFDRSGLSIANYDSILIAWEAKPHLQNVNFSNQFTLRYCAAKVARDSLLADGWVISGDSINCNPDHFVSSWRVTDSILIIPTDPNYSYNYDVDWDNDEIFDTLGVQGSISHLYLDSIQTKTIRIRGDFPSIKFGQGDKGRLIALDQWGSIPFRSLDHAFDSCYNLSRLDFQAPNLDSASSLAFMFRNTTHNIVYSWDLLYNWDVSTITNMQSMFENCRGLANINLNNWDVSSVTNMNSMFRNTYLNFFRVLDLSAWDVSSVTDMASMFEEIDGVINPSSWNVSNVTDMSKMFKGAYIDASINSWDVSNVTDMSDMFSQAHYTYSLNNWDVSSVSNMSGMFYSSNFNMPLSNWDVSNVTDMSSMFEWSGFNHDISNWDVSNVTDMSSMFAWSFFNKPIQNWDVSSVTNMSKMFANGWYSAFNQPLDNWDVSSVSDISSMFEYSSNFNQDISSWDVSNVTNMDRTFYEASVFDQNLGNWDIASLSTALNMFDSTAMSVSNYDSTLIGWESKLHTDSINLGAAGLYFCLSKTARDSLIADGWNIYGDNLDPACVLTDIKDSDNQINRLSEIRIYPNPSRGKIYIELQNQLSNEPLLIYNQSVQLVKTVKLSNGLNSIDLSDLPNGLYLIRWGNRSEKVILSH